MPSDKESPSSEKKGFFQRLKESRSPKEIPEEDVLKYTGKNKAELMNWASETPGVAGNQLAGKITIGSSGNGIGTHEAGSGLGGWGWSAEPNDPQRGMKFPPTKTNKEKELDGDTTGSN